MNEPRHTPAELDVALASEQACAAHFFQARPTPDDEEFDRAIKEFDLNDGQPNLTAFSDEDLINEIESRGYIVGGFKDE